MDLAEVLDQLVLVGHGQDADELVAAEGLDPLAVVGLEEDVAGEQRQQRPDPRPAGVRPSWTTWGR